MSQRGSGESRSEGRDARTPRSIRVEVGVIEGIPGSVLYRSGKTEVLCVATVEEGTPPWRGVGLGWLTGDYHMTPYATVPRGSSPTAGRIDGRSQEIRRLIGRSLRTSVDPRRIPGLTIHLDCEVLRADGGTRTASINGASIALSRLVASSLESGRFPQDPRIETVLGISVGRVRGENLVDLDYSEDSAAEIDLNVVATPAGNLVEIQGASESQPLAPAIWHELVEWGGEGISQVATMIVPFLHPIED